MAIRRKYDGANRRIRIFSDFDGETPQKVQDDYHRGQQVIESRFGEDGQPTGGHQYLWSPRYIDSPILRDTLDSGGEIVAAERILYLSDANYNVTGLVKYNSGESAWRVVERYSYTPYGVATFRDADWTAYAGPNPQSQYSNTTLYTGRTWDALISLYYYRARFHDALLERFITRDPVQADINLYRYVKNNSLNRVDPLGLQEVCERCGADITELIAAHLTAFVSQPQGDLSWFWPSGASSLEPIATANGTAIMRAVEQANEGSDCGRGNCIGTATLCDLCMSGHHVRHILIMVYIAESYSVETARSAGQYNESFWLGFFEEGREFEGSSNAISNADLTFNEVALCFAKALKHADVNGGVTDPLTVSEICDCVKKLTAEQRTTIAMKPGWPSRGNTRYDTCPPCDISAQLPAGLQMPPIDL